jgi:hypothetical protein
VTREELRAEIWPADTFVDKVTGNWPLERCPKLFNKGNCHTVSLLIVHSEEAAALFAGILLLSPSNRNVLPQVGQSIVND